LPECASTDGSGALGEAALAEAGADVGSGSRLEHVHPAKTAITTANQARMRVVTPDPQPLIPNPSECEVV
jgi:hypothetical protein